MFPRASLYNKEFYRKDRASFNDLKVTDVRAPKPGEGWRMRRETEGGGTEEEDDRGDNGRVRKASRPHNISLDNYSEY